MNPFLQQHGKLVSGMVSGWDRLRFRGTLQKLCHAEGMNAFIRTSGRLFKEFKEFAIWSSTQLKEAALEVAKRLESRAMPRRQMRSLFASCSPPALRDGRRC